MLECPVCGSALRGSDTQGYRCVRCHAHYTTKFVRRMRWQVDRMRLNEHFGRAQVAEEERAIVEVPSGLEGLLSHRR